MADAALPVSQALPDTAIELWDFGDDEQCEHDYDAAGLDANSKAAEALQELEEFCKSEFLGSIPKIPAQHLGFTCHSNFTGLNCLAIHTVNTLAV